MTKYYLNFDERGEFFNGTIEGTHTISKEAVVVPYKTFVKVLQDSTNIYSLDKDGNIVDNPRPAQEVDFEAIAIGEVTRLRVRADYMIAPLQDAVDLDDFSEEEVKLLKRWKEYRVALNRVPLQDGYPVKVVWPDAPV